MLANNIVKHYLFLTNTCESLICQNYEKNYNGFKNHKQFPLKLLLLNQMAKFITYASETKMS